MTKFRALVIAGVLALTFNFVGCFDHGGDPCQLGAPAGSAGGSDGLLTAGGEC